MMSEPRTSAVPVCSPSLFPVPCSLFLVLFSSSSPPLPLPFFSSFIVIPSPSLLFSSDEIGAEDE
ncbi:MAG TPA: hypothetical protein VM223_23085, partial [Planctomycetota bacterium]|nr:hypothetical protein [Planctomycetota bacterium]